MDKVLTMTEASIQIQCFQKFVNFANLQSVFTNATHFIKKSKTA